MDSTVGGATATGLGEDLMKGIISYEIVRLMEQGIHPQEACEIAVKNLSKKINPTKRKCWGFISCSDEQQRGMGSSDQYCQFLFL